MLLIRNKTVNRCYLQPFFFRNILLLSLKFLIIHFGSFHTLHGKHSIKSVQSTIFDVIVLISVRFGIEYFQDIFRNLRNSLRMKKHFFLHFCKLFFIQLLFRTLKFYRNIIVIHLKLQHLFISNRIRNHIRMQLCSEHIRSSIRPQCILRKNWCSRKTELIIFFKRFLNILLCISKLRTMTFIINQHTVLVIDFMIRIFLHKLI